MIPYTLPVPGSEVAILLVLGLVAGVLGGLLGVGGSIVMIPVLTLLLDKSQHLAQAAAMLVNVVVSIPSAWHHHRAEVVRWDVFARMLPPGIVAVLIGVYVSDLFSKEDEEKLKWLFGAFLIYVVAFSIFEMIRRNGSDANEPQPPRISWSRCGMVGAVTGFVAGLLGVGGGVLAVPLLHRICGLPLRQCIGTSSAVIILTALIGAIMKNWTLPTHVNNMGEVIMRSESFTLFAVLAPTAIIGGLLGARLTHALPLKLVNAVLMVILSIAAVRLIGLWPW